MSNSRQEFMDAAKLRQRILELESRVTELETNEIRFKKYKRRMALEQTVNCILTETRSQSLATIRILQAVCETIGWGLGSFWNFDRSSNLLYCKKSWHRPSVRTEKFEMASREYVFCPGYGYPGYVLASGKPNWHSNYSKELFPRSPLAAKVGLNAACGFPIMLGDQVLGVMEFFRSDVQEPDQELLQYLDTLGRQIGEFSWKNCH